jgi:hypothetical protein
VIVGGLTLPAARTVNAAGTRAFVGGGFAFVADDVLALDVALDVVEAPPALLVAAAAVVVDVTNVEDVVDAETGVVVEACFEPPHAARSRAHAIATKRRATLLTFPA